MATAQFLRNPPPFMRPRLGLSETFLYQEEVPERAGLLLEKKLLRTLVAHDCGYPLSRYTCRATRVAADFLDFIAFCRCSTGVALHPLKIFVSHPPPPPCAGRCHTEIWV